MLSQDISPMVSRKGRQGRLAPEHLAQLGTSSHQLGNAPTHRGAALSEQGSVPAQLLGTTDSANELQLPRVETRPEGSWCCSANYIHSFSHSANYLKSYFDREKTFGSDLTVLWAFLTNRMVKP